MNFQPRMDANHFPARTRAQRARAAAAMRARPAADILLRRLRGALPFEEVRLTLAQRARWAAAMRARAEALMVRRPTPFWILDLRFWIVPERRELNWPWRDSISCLICRARRSWSVDMLVEIIADGCNRNRNELQAATATCEYLRMVTLRSAGIQLSNA